MTVTTAPTLMVTVRAEDIEDRSREGGIVRMLGTCVNGARVTLITDEEHLSDLMRRSTPVGMGAVAIEVPLHSIEGGC